MPSDLRITRSLSSPKSVRAQPQRAAFLVGVAVRDQFAHGLLDLAVRIQRGLEEVGVEGHAERLEIEILFAAQPGHREVADRLEIVDVAAPTTSTPSACTALAVEVGARDVLDVVAAIAVGGPGRRLRLDAARARLHRQREVGDLHAGVVVVELAHDAPAVRVEHARDRVADRRGAAVADVQRTGRIGGDELDAGGAPGAGVAAPVGGALLEHAGHLALVRGRTQEEVDEAGTGDLDLGDRRSSPAARRPAPRPDRAACGRRLGQQQRGIGRKIAVLAVARAFDDEARASPGGSVASARSAPIASTTKACSWSFTGLAVWEIPAL